MLRAVLHMDMDAFYASIEQNDQPELKGTPVIVGGSTRGVVSAASYEARKFGIRSAMSMQQAKKLCPQGNFLPVRMSRYKQVSQQVMQILKSFSPLVEQASVDEAYVDISGSGHLFASSFELGRQLKREIKAKTHLSCSVGIAPNKFLAKIASNQEKPDGLTLISQAEVAEFMFYLPVEKIPGVGEKTKAFLYRLNVHKAGDILNFPLSFWEDRLGKAGKVLFAKAQGIDHSPVNPEQRAKSFSAENTFSQDLEDLEELKRWLYLQADRVGKELRSKRVLGKTITLKIKYADFKTITRSKSLAEASNANRIIYDAAVQLLKSVAISKKVRLIGLGVSNLLSSGTRQGSFFIKKAKKKKKLDCVLDDIQKRFGKKAIQPGRIHGFLKSD